MRLPFTIDIIVPRIVEIGLERMPNEACGLVVPNLDITPDQWVLELINRSPDPTSHYVFDTTTLKAILVDPDVWEDVLVWHTHPKGNIGPSKGDMDARHPSLKYLVVSLPRGEAVLF